MKMVFKNLQKFQFHLCRRQMPAGIILLAVMTPLYADVTVNNAEKNDKVAVDGQPARSELFNQSSIVESRQWELSAEQWEFARSGESIMSLPVLNDVINNWLKDRQKVIEIQYPGGEEGEFWVQELADWLVSLGIPSNHMIIVPGSGSGDIIKFDLIKQ